MATLSNLDKIQILLHEYDSLRDEIVQRWVGAQTDISIGVLVFIGTLTIIFSTNIQPTQRYVLFGVLGVSVCVFVFAMWQVGRDTYKLAERVRQIEHQTNELAGEEILQWETRWGGAVTGFFGAGRPLLDQQPKAD